MDSLTHVFVVTIATLDSLSGPYFFALVLGAIIPDVDIFFKAFSDRHPSLYIFSHGGITHSVAGALAMALPALTGTALALGAGVLSYPGSGLSWFLMGIFFVFGTFSHLFLDALAYPGIPLLYPYSPRKYTAGIFPGPSLVMFAASLVLATVILTGYGGSSLTMMYAIFGILFISVSGAIALAVQNMNRGRAIPTLHPFRWLILTEDGAQYVLSSFNIISGRGREKIFPKYTNTSPQELENLVREPEYQRLQFYSYAVTANREGNTIVFSDPLRSERIIFYPPYYTRLIVPLPE